MTSTTKSQKSSKSKVVDCECLQIIEEETNDNKICTKWSYTSEKDLNSLEQQTIIMKRQKSYEENLVDGSTSLSSLDWNAATSPLARQMKQKTIELRECKE